MIEVFKTDVETDHHARMLVHLIEQRLGYHANFDLSDCDRILRVQCKDGCVHTSLISLLKEYGFYAEVLSEEISR
jgi:hypothetical protein